MDDNVRVSIRMWGEGVQDETTFILSRKDFERLCDHPTESFSEPWTPSEYVREVVKFLSESDWSDSPLKSIATYQMREGQIALALLKLILKEKGMKLGDSLKRDLGNIAKDAKIPLDELKEFGKRRVAELSQETFGK